jgi:hypothetical protein
LKARGNWGSSRNALSVLVHEDAKCAYPTVTEFNKKVDALVGSNYADRDDVVGDDDLRTILTNVT